MTTQSSLIKPLKFSGSWYSKDPDEINNQVSGFLEKATLYPVHPKMMVIPHAGLRFSGEIAATGYKIFERDKNNFDRAILIGPSHKHAFKGIAISSAQAFDTPFGALEIDLKGYKALTENPEVSICDEAFANEHCLEMQLPFLKKIKPDLKIIPMIVGDEKPEIVANILEPFLKDEKTFIFISSDLSHFHNYKTARKLDNVTGLSIDKLNPVLQSKNACGHRAINGAIHLAHRHDMRPTTLDLRNSGDTIAPKDRVVGYGVFAFEAFPYALPKEYRDELYRVANLTIEHGLKKGRKPQIRPETFSRPLRTVRGSFVTLNDKNGHLRGCQGTVGAVVPLVQDISECAYRSAFGDKRFKPMTTEEWKSTSMSLSVMGCLRPLEISSEEDLLTKLKPFEEGLVIQDKGKNAIFLPQVWEGIPDPKLFLTRLKQKAGMKENHWSDSFKAMVFTVEKF